MIHFPKNFRRLLSAVALGLAIAAGSIAAAEESPANHRPCKPDELLGLWKVVHWTKYADKDKLGAYVDPHQWYLFSRDGSLRSTSSSEPNENVPEIKKELEKQPVVVHYMCPTSGIVETIRSDQNGPSELWRAFFVTKDAADSTGKIDLRSGDVVMMLMGTKDRPVYVRQIRKLTD
jgi:hypothetical protein